MTPYVVALAAAILGRTPAPEPEHAANPVYKELLGGLDLGGAEVRLPAPILHDGQTADEQRAALRVVAGTDRAVEALVRDSISAPQVMKVHDLPAKGEALVRSAGLWFVLYADLDRLDTSEFRRRVGEGKPVEAGNMRLESRLLGADDLKARRVEPLDDRREWYTHLDGRLLDRIGFESTEHTAASRSEGSVVVATRTAPAFDDDPRSPNRWWPIRRPDGGREPSQTHPYAGGASYVKVSRLKFRPGALLVESQFAFSEPRAWFDGAPILRSKIGLVAQDQVRALRRELAERRKP